MKTEIINHFNEKPQTKIAWLAMGLGLAAVFEIPILVFVGKIIESQGGYFAPQSIGVMGIVLTTAALITGLIAYRRGERS